MEVLMSMMTAMMQQMQKTTELQIQEAEYRETLDREERAREAESRRTEQEKFQEFMEATLNGRGADRSSMDSQPEATEKVPNFPRMDSKADLVTFLSGFDTSKFRWCFTHFVTLNSVIMMLLMMVHFNVSNIIFVDFSFNMLLEKELYYNNTQNKGDFWDQPIRSL